MEFYLLRAGLVDGVDLNDPREVRVVSSRVFSNCWCDQQALVGRIVTEDNDFTREENEEFVRYATERVAPIFDQYFAGMRIVVNELLSARKMSGARVRAILQIGVSR